MLPKDGQFTVYVLVFKRDGQWSGLAHDYFGCPPVTGNASCSLPTFNPDTWRCSPYHKDYIYKAGEIVTHPHSDAGFTACGTCWQTTGIHGTFELAAAREGVVAMRKRYPEKEFAIKKVMIQQASMVIDDQKIRSAA